jgi:hypothetical protein
MGAMDAQGEAGGTGRSAMLVGVVPAGNGRRAASAAITVGCGVTAAAAPAISSSLAGASPGLSVLAACVIGGGYFLATAAALGRTGRSIGGLAVGVRTVDARSATPLGAGRALLRLSGLAVRPVSAESLPARTRARRDPGPWNRITGTVTARLSTGRDPMSLALRPIPADVLGAVENPASVERERERPQTPAGRTTAGTATPGAASPGAVNPADVPWGTEPHGPVAEETVIRPHAATACLLSIDNGSSVRLTGTALLGRNPSAEGDTGILLLPLPDLSRTLSKTHASIEWDGSDAWVQDMYSTNGSVIIGVDGTQAPLPAGVRTPFPPGAAILIGNRTIRRATEADTGARPKAVEPVGSALGHQREGRT